MVQSEQQGANLGSRSFQDEDPAFQYRIIVYFPCTQYD
jgi:hypothetical protein